MMRLRLLSLSRVYANMDQGTAIISSVLFLPLASKASIKHAKSRLHCLSEDVGYAAAVCGSVGQDAARALGQASLSPMLEGEGSIPVRDVGFSPLIIINMSNRLAGVFSGYSGLLPLSQVPSK